MNHYRRHFIAYEFWLPIIAVLIFALVMEFVAKTNPIDTWLYGIRKDLYVTIASISGALLGFAITAVSIAIAFIGHGRFEIIRKSVHYHTLYQVFLVAIKYLAVTTIVAIIGLILDRDSNPQHWVTYLNLLGVILSVIALIRCVWILENIIYIITIEPKS